MKTKGFTLVELLVVIAILAILATVSVVGYTSFITNANNSAALSELTQVRDYHIANEYLNEDVDITTIPAAVGLTGVTLAEYGEDADGDTWYVYTKDEGKAYWNIDTDEVTTTAPTLASGS